MTNLVRTRETLPEINRQHRAKMEALEASIVAELVPVEMDTRHHFAHGVYTRELRLPAGTVVTGAIHRHSCTNIVAHGEGKVVTDEGTHFFKAPHIFVSGPGVKKAVYCITDIIWLNVHPWEGEPDLEAIEREVIIPSYEALEHEQQLALGRDK